MVKTYIPHGQSTLDGRVKLPSTWRLVNANGVSGATTCSRHPTVARTYRSFTWQPVTWQLAAAVSAGSADQHWPGLCLSSQLVPASALRRPWHQASALWSAGTMNRPAMRACASGCSVTLLTFCSFQSRSRRCEVLPLLAPRRSKFSETQLNRRPLLRLPHRPRHYCCHQH